MARIDRRYRSVSQGFGVGCPPKSSQVRSLKPALSNHSESSSSAPPIPHPGAVGIVGQFAAVKKDLPIGQNFIED